MVSIKTFCFAHTDLRIRFQLTSEEMFFPLMQLSDADRFVTSSGALRVKAVARQPLGLRAFCLMAK